MSHQPTKLTVAEIAARLAEPFDPQWVRWLPQHIAGDKCAAVPYLDARAIQDRLDGVLGIDGWQDEYQETPDGSVICRLRLRLGRRWTKKVDVGSPSQQKDAGDRRKSAFSDALKRAAVKFGIGRYLYRLSRTYVPYDAKAKKMASIPQLPAWALPGGSGRPSVAAEVLDRIGPQNARAASPAANVYAGNNQHENTMPRNGAELLGRLEKYEDQLVRDMICCRGDLVKHVRREMAKLGHDCKLPELPLAALPLAVRMAKAFGERTKWGDTIRMLALKLRWAPPRLMAHVETIFGQHARPDTITEEQGRQVILDLEERLQQPAGGAA